jgi:hypothetical protein
MPHDVTVALVGDPRNPYTAITDDEWERTWDDRPRVALEVAEHESLASILDRAAASFNVADPGYSAAPHVLFDVALHRADLPLGFGTTDIALIDEHGVAFWNAWDYRLIPYQDVLDSVEAGAMEGDPRHLALILREHAGNGVILDWPDLLQAWDVAWEVAKAVGVVGGVAATAKLVIDSVQSRIERGRQSVWKQAPRWSRRGASHPPVISSFLADRTWDPEALSQFLACSLEDAEAALEVFGYAQAETGLWEREGDEPARLLRLIYSDAVTWHGDRPAEEWLPEFRQRVEVILTTGQAPPEPDVPSHVDYTAEWQREQRREKAKKGAVLGVITAAAFALGSVLGRRRN